MIQVECYAGYRGNQYPIRFWLSERRIEISEQLAQWTEPRGRCFRVKGHDGRIYELLELAESGEWRLLHFSPTPAP